MFVKTNLNLKFKDFLKLKRAEVSEENRSSFDSKLSGAERNVDQNIGNIFSILEDLNNDLESKLSENDLKEFFRKLM